jgi:hypothetical protein
VRAAQVPPTTSIAHLQERFGATLPYLDESLVDDVRAQNWISASPVSWSNAKLMKKKPKNTKLSSRTT